MLGKLKIKVSAKDLISPLKLKFKKCKCGYELWLLSIRAKDQAVKIKAALTGRS